MRQKDNMLLAALAALASEINTNEVTAVSPLPQFFDPPRQQKQDSFPTEEREALAELHGKAKKQRVRELVAKYGGRR